MSGSGPAHGSDAPPATTGTAGSGAGARSANSPARPSGGAPPEWPDASEMTLDRHRWVPWAVALVIVAFAIAVLATYSPGPSNAAAVTKANRVITLFRVHGLRPPVDRAGVVSLLGNNGGPVCAAPDSALNQSLQDQQLANGAANVGARPVRVDHRYLAGELLVLQVYCPQKAPAFLK